MMSKYPLRLWTAFSLTLICTLLLASLASAHVTVKPASSAAGAWETYTIKIPTEKDVPTVKVTLKIPAGTELEQYQPLTGWKTTVQKDDSGQASTITWEAANTGIEPGQFQQFNFVAKNPSAEGSVAWDAFQYYSDGTVVEWTGNEGTDNPHSITQITAPAAEAGVDQGTATANNPSAAQGSGGSDSGSGKFETANFIISIIALLAALAALWFAVLNGRRHK